MRGVGPRARSLSLTLLFLAAISTLALSIAGSALATSPGADGKIYYQGPQSGESGPADIFRVNPDGSEPQDLTAGNGFSEERPNVSADGQHVVFQSFRDEGWNIFSMNADGSNQVDLTNTQFEPNKIINFEPTWSPDGSKVAFMRQSKFVGEEQDIWAMDANGANPVDLTHTAGAFETSPEYSPDGTKIVYVRGADNDDIWVMNANGTGQTPLTETSAPVQNVAPTWSPDGTKIAYSVLEGPVGERGLHVMNANGTSQAQLLDGSAPIQSNVLSWSPDGTRIAYKSTGLGGEIRLVGASGGSTSLLVENSGADYPSWAAVPAGAGGTTPPSTPPGSTPPASTTVSSPISSPAPKVTPSDHFVLGRPKLNKKKGTAVLAVSVPGPGTVVLTGKGVKKARAVAKGAGKLSLTIRAAGRAGQKLTETGEVRLKLKITFTPVGGAPATEAMKVTLKLNAR